MNQENHNPGILPLRTHVFFWVHNVCRALGSVSSNRNKTGKTESMKKTLLEAKWLNPIAIKQMRE